MRKIYILDTNVLLHDPGSIRSFQDNVVIVPIYVIEEVDHFKKEATELGRNAREVSRILDAYRTQGNLSEGVSLEGGGLLRVILHQDYGLSGNGKPQTVDNALLALAQSLRGDPPAEVPVILVTKDTNLRIKADALGIRAEDYETGRVALDELYRGQVELVLPLEEVEQLRRGQPIPAPAGDWFPNEYAWVRTENGPARSGLGRLSADRERIQPLRVPEEPILNLKPKNKEQFFAMDALLDPEIGLVTLMGKAGTGKTLLAIAAGLHQVQEDKRYGRVLVSRPVFPWETTSVISPGRSRRSSIRGCSRSSTTSTSWPIGSGSARV
jgi:PhoH-like ATPase